MIIGTHNTFSYLKPKRWWLRPFNFIAKCQNTHFTELKELYPQKEVGLCFDIRVYWDEGSCSWNLAHGSMSFKLDSCFGILSIFSVLNTLGYDRDIYVRLILEREGMEDLFICLCSEVEETFTNITFYGGVRKKDWKQLYKFKNNHLELKTIQYVGSMAKDARWYEKIIPYLYAKRMNEENKSNVDPESDNIYLFDFINI